jgi:hypothetical protein
VLAKIESWIDETLEEHHSSKISCISLHGQLSGYFNKQYLGQCFYVPVKTVPKPDFPELYQAGFEEFLTMDSDGVTYRDTYFIKESMVRDFALHLHELVHAMQWTILGSRGFIQRYMDELSQHGYNDSLLEDMAYYVDELFRTKQEPIDVMHYVRSKI